MESNIAGIARSAVLCTVFISTYSGRKQDKSTAEEVALSKGAGSKRAVSMYKSLFADSTELGAITSYASAIREQHYKLTLPWDDFGARLLPTAQLLSYQSTMTSMVEEFDRLVAAFLTRYDSLVAVAAFKLGAMFDRNEYPTRDELLRKFKVFINFTPLPTSGDFRLDIETEVMDEMAAKYEALADERVGQAVNDAWVRLHEMLQRLSKNLNVPEDGKKPRLHDSMMDNAIELCELLTSLNITQDPALETARLKLEKALFGIDTTDLRESDELRKETKVKVDAILDAYNW